MDIEKATRMKRALLDTHTVIVVATIQAFRWKDIQKLEKKPELKQSYQTIVKDLPVEKQQQAIAQLARKNERIINRKQESAKASVRV